MNPWPNPPRLDELDEDALEAIAEDRADPGRAAGDDRQADVEADRHERWLDSCGP